MPAPLISVIVPHLNQQEALGLCLESLAQQRYRAQGFEVIVVDNGSEPRPGRVVAAFPGTRLLEEATPGPGPARNRGAGAARGEILAFIDADCRADAGWLQAIADEMERLRATPGSGRKGPVLGGKVEIACADPARPTGIEAYETAFSFRQRLYIEKKGFSGSGNLAVAAEDFAAIGPFAGKEIAEDRDWGRRATAMGYHIRYLPEMVVSHPARKSLAELYEKWDRQVLHDYAAHRQSVGSRLRWCLRAAAVALSPLLDTRRIILGNTAGLAAKAGGCRVLFAVRVARGRRMLRLALAPQSQAKALRWNTCSRS